MILLFERAGWGMPQEYFPLVQGFFFFGGFSLLIGLASFLSGFRAGMRHAERKTKEFEHLK